MLSGIGNEAELKKVGIKPVANLPGVGKNFQDHVLLASCLWEPNAAIPTGNNVAEATFFWKSDSSIPTPDLQPFLIEIPYASEVIGPKYQPTPTCWAISPGLVRPKSRGHLQIRSSNPNDKIAIFGNHLAELADVKALTRAVELVRELGNSAPMKEFAKREVAPGPVAGKDMEEFIRDAALSYFHETGTCKMGVDADAVVDGKLKVRGIQNLRIADGSIMPTVTTGNTMASCVIIGERMAEILKGP
jgi:choline dehydrogenase